MHNTFLRYIVYLNIIVSMSAGILSAGFAHMIGFERKESVVFGLFSFFATLAVYNGQRLFKVSEISTPWLDWVRENTSAIRWLTFFASMMALFLAIWLIHDRDFWYISFWMFPSVLVSFLYVFRVKGKNLRDLPHLKIHMIAFAWVSVLILFPYFCTYYVTLSYWKPFTVLIVAHYFYVIAVTIPFDIRDLKYDKRSQKTLPQVLGVGASKGVAVMLLLVAGILLLSWTPIRWDNYWFYGALLLQVLLVMGMHTKRSDFYCAGWIDGAIAFLGFAYFLN